MYTNFILWAEIRRRVSFGEMSINGVAAREHMSRNTVRKILRCSVPPRYVRKVRKPTKLDVYIPLLEKILAENDQRPAREQLTAVDIFYRLRNEGFVGGYSAITAYIRSRRRPLDWPWSHAVQIVRTIDQRSAVTFLRCLSGRSDKQAVDVKAADRIAAAVPAASASGFTSRLKQMHSEAFSWLRDVQTGKISTERLMIDLSRLRDPDALIEKLRHGSARDQKRVLAIFGLHHGISQNIVCEFLRISRNTSRRYRRLYAHGGATELFGRTPRSNLKTQDEGLKRAIFALLHEPPSSHGINRTSWRLEDLARTLKRKGTPACAATIRTIVRNAGYRWRHARVALTSHDPDYRAKLVHIQEILHNLTAREAFFSIDEFGPFAVKMKPGLALAAPGEQRVVPQWQKSRGCLIMTAALELSGNRVTHFYSNKKNTAEMIRMMELLVLQYRDYRKLYLSWDAASWHISKQLQESIAAHNTSVAGQAGPMIEIAPLPAGAQFLNVIESIFSGMARGIIHNSNYESLEATKCAIDSYFAERNEYFRLNPKRAGKKIWGQERERVEFSASSNCKDPRYR